MWSASILKEHDLPAPPMRPDHLQIALVRVLVPYIRDQQQRITAADIERSVKDAAGVAASDGHARLLADPTVTTIERRRFADDRLIQHEHDGALLSEKAPF